MPLKSDYKFVYLQKGSCCTELTLLAFKAFLGSRCRYIDSSDMEGHYNQAINSDILVINEPDFKLLWLLPNNIDVVFATRDPISIIKHGINHINNLDENMYYGVNKIRLSTNIDGYLFHKPYYAWSNSYEPDIGTAFDYFVKLCEKNIRFNIEKKITIIKDKINNIKCFEFDDFSKFNAYNTFVNLFKKYEICSQVDKTIFENRANRNDGSLCVLPVELYVNSKDLTKIKSENILFKKIKMYSDDIVIKITTKQLQLCLDRYVDITLDVFGCNEQYFENVIVLINKVDVDKLKSNTLLYEHTIQYIIDYLKYLKIHEEKIQSLLIDENKILGYLKTNKQARDKLKLILDNDLIYIKDNYPEYLFRWKYYQEFLELFKSC